MKTSDIFRVGFVGGLFLILFSPGAHVRASEGMFLTLPDAGEIRHVEQEATPKKTEESRQAADVAQTTAQVQPSDRTLAGVLNLARYGVHKVQFSSAKATGEGTPPELFYADNPTQDFGTLFAPKGIRMGAKAKNGWVCIFKSDPLETEGSERAVEGQKFEYRRGGLSEWYLNTSKGLEKGFTIDERPGTDDKVRDNDWLYFRSIMLSNLKVTKGEKGAVIDLKDKDGSKKLRLGELLAIDSTGQPLLAQMAHRDGLLTWAVNDRDAIYPIILFSRISAKEKELAKKGK